MVRRYTNLLFSLVPTALMVRSFGSNPLQTMFRNNFQGSVKHLLEDTFRKLACSFSPDRAVWAALRRRTFIQFCQGELQHAATLSRLFRSVMRLVFFPLSLCYKIIGSSSDLSCAPIELWMHLGWRALVKLELLLAITSFMLSKPYLSSAHWVLSILFHLFLL